MKEKLKWLYKIVRPPYLLASAGGTWVVAIICNGPDMLSVNKLAAAACMALSFLASSIFHYGAAHEMYKAKWYDPVDIPSPTGFILTGASLFIASIFLACLYLPASCVGLMVFNAIAIGLYGVLLSRTWVMKNIIIASICSTPIVLGWWAGSHAPPILAYALGTIFFAYTAREMMLDIRDEQANRQRKRRTVPIVFGVTGTMRVAGAVMLVSACFGLLLAFKTNASPVVIIPAILGVFLFIAVATILFTQSTPGQARKMITAGTYCFMLSVLMTKVNL